MYHQKPLVQNLIHNAVTTTHTGRTNDDAFYDAAGHDALRRASSICPQRCVMPMSLSPMRLSCAAHTSRHAECASSGTDIVCRKGGSAATGEIHPCAACCEAAGKKRSRPDGRRAVLQDGQSGQVATRCAWGTTCSVAIACRYLPCCRAIPGAMAIMHAEERTTTCTGADPT